MKTAFVVLGALLTSSALSFAGSGAQLTFGKPIEATKALVAAVEEDNYSAFLNVVGSEVAEIWRTGDPVRDAIERIRFLDAVRRTNLQADVGNPNRMILYLGYPAKPFPAPLIREDEGWRFDSSAAVEELANRRIRRNESAAIESCRGYRDAQLEYYARALTFAQKIRSAPGDQDGLYWLNDGEVDESFVGPSFAHAAYSEPQPEPPRPLFGYYFRILPAQGPDAPGGVLDYRSGGRMMRGFALIAWPAEYGVSGLRSFLINHLGDIYQKDLGSNTPHAAAAITVFDPDPTWTRILADAE